MKRAALPLIAILFMLPGLAQADSAYGSLQSVHEKNTVLKDLRNTSAKPFWQYKETIRTTTGKRWAKLNARICNYRIEKRVL